MKSADHLAYYCIFMTVFIVISFSSVKTYDLDQFCSLQMTCAKCIGADFRCVWCYDNLSKNNKRLNNVHMDKLLTETRSYSKPRCGQEKTHELRGCNQSKILNPSYKIDYVQDKSLSDDQKILIKPQKLRLQFRPHETARIPLKFYTTNDHEVDMYFLIDLSYTMKKHTEELSRVSMDLVNNIRNLTRSFQVGIGSFIDKIIRPFGSSTVNEKNTYEFMQQMKLTNDFKQFEQIVSKLRDMTASNYDDPEGGLDALMQAVVCGDKIGWRKNSRKLIIYCSDAPFHFAGDGQLAGIVIPNDGICHMNNSIYTKEFSQDYPSIEHIAQVVDKQKVTLIFAVAGQDHQSVYHYLSKSLRSSYVSELGSENSTIANIVTNGYKNITSTVKMKSDNPNFKVDFMTNCTNGQWVNSTKCSKIKLGEAVDFRAVITAPECPKGNQSQVHKIHIYPINSNAQLEIEVELICKCDCEEKEHNSPACNNNGLLVCGECRCNEDFSGQQCKCDLRDKDRVNDCSMGNSTVECYGRGSCECGVCVCHNMASNRNRFYSGTYCECDDYSCYYSNGLLCGGPLRGECKCGRCECTPEYTSDNCDCPASKEHCRSNNKKICNGHGQCECGVCKCDESSGFSGDTCEHCPTCNNWCEINKECVKCWMSKDGGNMLECGRLCRNNSVFMVEKLEAKSSAQDYSPVCKVQIDKCIIRYQTILLNKMEQVRIRRKKECPESKTVVIVVSIVVGIFILGLIILVIWKVITTIFDRREMARFNEEKARATWTTQMNPLFIQTSTTYENPTWILNG